LSLFEFILVMVSLVLAIAVTHLLDGVARVVRDRSRFELNWVTPLWALFLFLLILNHWWSLWDMREANWNFPAFFYIVLAPTLLFLAVTILKPRAGVEKVSLTAEFQQIRIAFLSIMFVVIALVTWDGFLLGTEAAWNRLRLVQVFVLTLIALGLVTKNWVVQNIVAAGLLTCIVASSFVLRFMPDAFGTG